MVPAASAATDTSSAAPGSTRTTTSAVTSGPAVKIVSVSTESSANAPCNRPALWPNRRGYSTRITDWVGGNAAPATNAAATSATVGAPARASTTTATSPAPHAAASESSARGPRWSISRAVSGAPSPVPSASAPEAAPALANDPVSARTSRMIARPLIPIGSRASSDAANSRATVGVLRISR